MINAAGTVNNNGDISGTQGFGVFIDGAGTVNNQANGTNQYDATITGDTDGVHITAAGTINNDGEITGVQGLGAFIGGAGSVDNMAGASLTGATMGVDIVAAGNVLNAGNIAGTNGDGVFVGAAGDVVNAAGGTITGTGLTSHGVEISGVGTLENAGTIGGGKDAVYFDTADATLIVHPGAVFNGAVKDGGVGGGMIELTTGQAPGTLTDLGTNFTGFQTVTIATGASWTISGPLSGFQGVAIKGFNDDDKLVLTGLAAGDTATLDATNLLTIATAGGTTVGTVQFDASVAGQSFSLASNGQGGTEITVCYLRGTRILTDRGEVAVEDLRLGDHAVTCAGLGAWLKPITWIGHTQFNAARHPRPHEVWPIRIRAGAFADAMPRRDLLVSPGHAFLIDGVLIQAEKLLNGATIFQDQRIERGAYFHVELASHDVLLAEGVPAESYLDTGNRDVFDGASVFRALHPDFSPKAWDDTCVPLVLSGPAVLAAKARFLERAMQTHDVTRNPDAHLLLEDGRRIDPVSAAGGRLVFRLPREGAARLVSRVWVPAELRPGSDDRRKLGVRVGSLVLDGGPALSLDDGGLGEGWHGAERGATGIWRWTSGCASLPWAAREVEVLLVGNGSYWLHHDAAAAVDRAAA